MFKKLSDTQLLALSAAAQRDDRSFVPPPKSKGGALKASTAKLIAAGLVREVRAKGTAAIWRTDATTGRTYALKLTAKGQIAVAESDGEAETGAKSSSEATGRRTRAEEGQTADREPPGGSGRRRER